jgi:hypothetical protein
MPDLDTNMVEPVGGFQIQGMMMRYNVFMPRLYNWCLSLGFKPGKIMPSRAFCSDESQGSRLTMDAWAASLPLIAMALMQSMVKT